MRLLVLKLELTMEQMLASMFFELHEGEGKPWELHLAEKLVGQLVVEWALQKVDPMVEMKAY